MSSIDAFRAARRYSLGILALACLAGCQPATPPPAESAATPAGASAGITPAAEAASAAITGDAIRGVIAEIASDRYEGRGPGTPSDKAARAYLAEQLKAMGFAPGAADGSYEQPVGLVGITAHAPEKWTFTRGNEQIELERGSDFIVASGLQAPSVNVQDAELVFAGFAIEAPEYDWDDFKGVDVSGKVLVVLNNDPDWDPALFAGKERLYYGRWSYKYESAARHGAAGVIIVHTTPSAGYPWQVVQSSWSGTQFELPAGDEPRIALKAWATEAAARRLLEAAGGLDELTARAKDRDFAPVPLGITTSMAFENTIEQTASANVIGVLPGGDLADEYVIYTAHHDHLGVGDPNPNGDPNDKIYNGARDNASGVGMVMAIGRAFAALPERPRRSIMLLFVAAEEQGLLGSQYFAEHPTIPAGRIAANVNFDSGNIWGETSDLMFIGLGKSELDGVAETVAAHEHRVVRGDQFPDQGTYYRSDQFSFAKIGVPAFYFDGGTEFIGRPEGWGTTQIERYNEQNYHQPSDELTDDWNFDGMVQDARFGFYAGYIVANETEMPQWNPGDEFEAARKAALTQLGR
jgi:Zn-dependent M28 family amino/carboxypeptidase